MNTTDTVCHALHQAIEGRDVSAMMGPYRDDAELRVVDRDHPPSHAMERRGKEAIGTYFRDIMGRDLEQHVLDEIVSPDAFALTEECRNPDGTRVFVSSTLHLRDDKIAREVDVQAGDTPQQLIEGERTREQAHQG